MADPIFDPAQPSQDVTASVTPTFDPNQPSQDVVTPTFDPALSSESVYTLDDVKRSTAQSLADDAGFAPTRFGADNEAALQQDPGSLEKVIEAYRLKETKGSTLVQKGKKALAAAIPVAKRLFTDVKGGVETLKGITEAIPRLGKAYLQGGDAPATEALKLASEVTAIPASLESNVAAYLDLGKGAVRAGAEAVKGVARAATGPGKVTEAAATLGKSELTPEEFRARYFSDVGSARVSQEAAQGQGAVMEALGFDAAALAEQGIEVDAQKIQELSTITDPLNFVPVGAAVGVVGKGTRALGKQILAKTATEAQAAALAGVLNKARTAAVATARGTVGGSLEQAGRITEAAGRGIETSVRRVGGGFGGAGLGALIGQDITSALGGALALKVAPKVIKAAGRAAQGVGRMVSGKAPVPAVAGLAGEALQQGAIGAAEGAVLTAPFIIGARTEDEDQLLGLIPFAAGARAITAVGPQAVRVAGRAAQDRLAQDIFKTVEQQPVPENPYYGTDQNLDAVHSQSSAGLDPQEQNFVNLLRSKFEGSNVEIYSVDPATMKSISGSETAGGFAFGAAERLNPDGTTSPIFRVLLNKDTSSLPHEAYHAFEFLDAENAAKFEKTVSDNLTPEQRDSFAQIYNSSLNDGKPEAAWTRRLTDSSVVRETAAEAFSRIILGQDLSGTNPTVRKQAALFASGLLEKLGAKLADTGVIQEVGGSVLGGIRGGVDSVKLGNEWIQNLFSRIERDGELLTTEASKGYFGSVIPEDITLSKITPAPVVAAAPVAPATPTAPPTVPTQVPTPTTARNIRVTRGTQDRMAAKASDIGKARALTAAEKLGPEVVAKVNEVSDFIESGAPVLEIEHRGVKTELSPANPASRTSRRAEQEAAYLAEAAGAIPAEIREPYQKTFVPVRWEVVGGKPQLLAMSMDKVLANLQRSVKDAYSKRVEALVPYETDKGKLTNAGWDDAIADLQAYAANQANGYRGDGQKLVRPTEDVGLSIPAETAGYSPTLLSEPRANFQNLIQGIQNPPLTAREVEGSVPGNIKGQVLAEANLRRLEKPAAIRPEDLKKQEFKSFPGRSIQEPNPLRNQLSAAGVPWRELIEVTERINAPDISKVVPRPDLNFRAPVTDIIRGGFRPNVGETTADFGKRVMSMTKDEFNAMVADESLTGMAYDVGLALKNKEDLSILQTLADGAGEAFKAKLVEGDMDTAMDFALRKQFFNEAYQAATNTGGAVRGLPRLRPDESSPFPESSFQPVVNAAVREVGEKVVGRPLPELDYAPVNLDLAKRLADFYEAAKSDPADPEVQKSYQAFADETMVQYQAMVDAGYTIEPWKGGQEPYKSSDEMRADVRDNKHLYFFRTDVGFGNEALDSVSRQNPLLKPSGVGDLVINDIFRATHDFFGHNMQGFQFGPRGELNAWRAHSEMYSPEAQGALAAETLAQNSWVNNFSDHAERPITARPYAEQKNIVVPKAFIDEAKGSFMPRTEKGRAAEEAGFEIRHKENPAMPGVTVLKDGAPVGEIVAVRKAPDRAYVSLVGVDKSARGNALSEVMYRELGTLLQEMGVTEVEGTIVHPGAIRSRTNAFPDTTIVNDDGVQISPAEAIQALSEGEIGIDALSIISKDSSFRPGSLETLPGLNIESAEKARQSVVKRRIAGVREDFPEAIVPEFQRAEGKFVLDEDGKPKAVAIDYALADAPVSREAVKGIRGDAERNEAISDALSERLERTYKAAAKNPDIKAGEKWYSTARTRLKKIFGDDSKFFSELLGATSARTPVETNYKFSLDAYNRFRAGEYDDVIKSYREGKKQWEARDLGEFVEATGNDNPTKGQFLDWWVEKNDLLPRQTNGKKFGANSRAVLRVLDGSWREDVQGPKTPNFAGNLSGDTFEATIDVWAARLLHRLANEGNEKRWRILPTSETGVSDADFALGQQTFRKAADRLGIKPDALQAVLWFAEKQHWAERGWTRGAGAEKSDFNVLLAETEDAPTGAKRIRSKQEDLFEL